MVTVAFATLVSASWARATFLYYPEPFSSNSGLLLSLIVLALFGAMSVFLAAAFAGEADDVAPTGLALGGGAALAGFVSAADVSPELITVPLALGQISALLLHLLRARPSAIALIVWAWPLAALFVGASKLDPVVIALSATAFLWIFANGLCDHLSTTASLALGRKLLEITSKSAGHRLAAGALILIVVDFAIAVLLAIITAASIGLLTGLGARTLLAANRKAEYLEFLTLFLADVQATRWAKKAWYSVFTLSTRVPTFIHLLLSAAVMTRAFYAASFVIWSLVRVPKRRMFGLIIRWRSSEERAGICTRLAMLRATDTTILLLGASAIFRYGGQWGAWIAEPVYWLVQACASVTVQLISAMA